MTLCFVSFLVSFPPLFLFHSRFPSLPVFCPSFLLIPSLHISCFPSFLLYFLVSCLPSFCPYFLTMFLSSVLPSFLPSFNPSFSYSFVPFFCPSFLPVFLSSFIPSCPLFFCPSFFPVSLSSFLLSFLPVFLASVLSFFSSFSYWTPTWNNCAQKLVKQCVKRKKKKPSLPHLTHHHIML